MEESQSLRKGRIGIIHSNQSLILSLHPRSHENGSRTGIFELGDIAWIGEEAQVLWSRIVEPPNIDQETLTVSTQLSIQSSREVSDAERHPQPP
jgi:hypothetical protein